MLVVSHNRSDIAQTAIVSLATLSALGLLGWVLAYWTWQWFSPPADARIQAASEPFARVTVANDLFGKLPREVVSSGTALSVIGVIAAKAGGSGYAILRLAEQPIRTVREGEEIAPGIRLAEVHPDRVILERNGAYESFVLPEKRMPLETTAPAASKK